MPDFPGSIQAADHGGALMDRIEQRERFEEAQPGARNSTTKPKPMNLKIEINIANNKYGRSIASSELEIDVDAIPRDATAALINALLSSALSRAEKYVPPVVEVVEVEPAASPL